MLNSKKIDSSPNNGSNLMELMLQNGSNFSETSNARQLQSVLIQQMLYNNILDDDSIEHQFIDYLNGNFYSNSQNSDEKCTTNDCHLRLIPLHSSNSCEDNLANRNRKMKPKSKIGPAFFKKNLPTYNEGSHNSISLPCSNLKSKRKKFRSIGTILEKNIQINGGNKHTGKNGLKNKIRVRKYTKNLTDHDQLNQENAFNNHENDFALMPSLKSIKRINSESNTVSNILSQLENKNSKKYKVCNEYIENHEKDFFSMPSLDLMQTPNKLKLMEVKEQTAIAIVYANSSANDVVNIQLLPNLNLQSKPVIRKVIFDADWLFMINQNYQGENYLQCIFCQKIFKNVTDFIPHAKLKHPDLLFAVGMQLPANENVFFMGCRHCNYQTYDQTLLIIHFESEHGLSDISDGSKLPLRPPILLHRNTTRVMPNDHVISDECYSCLDCDIILTGSDSARSLLNHVLVDHPDTDNFNGCFVRMTRFVRPATNVTNAQVINDDCYSHLRYQIFCCLYCDYWTTSNYETISHNITVHLVMKILYKCPHCEIKLISRNHMVNHLKHMHSNMEQGYCTVSIIENLKECFIINRLKILST